MYALSTYFYIVAITVTKSYLSQRVFPHFILCGLFPKMSSFGVTEFNLAIEYALRVRETGPTSCYLPSEMNITGTLPQAGNLKLFVPSLSTQSSTRPKQNIFNVVLMRPDKTE